MYINDDSDAILSIGREEFDAEEVWEDLSEDEIAELTCWENVWKTAQENKGALDGK